MTYDLHIIKRLLQGYVALVGGLIVFFIVLHYVEYVDDFMDSGASMRDVFLVYYPSYVPEIIRLTSPLALFLSAIFLTGRLAQHLELSSLQTSGVSIYRIMVPYLMVGLLLTIALVYVGGWVVPESNRTRLAFELEYTRDGAGRVESSFIHRQTGPSSMMSVSFYDRRSRTATNVTLEDYASWSHLTRRIDAPRMTWVDSLLIWRLSDPVILTFDASGIESRTRVARIDTVLTLTPRDLARATGDVDAMTLTDAAHYIETLRRTGANGLERPLVAYYARILYPFAHLILLLLAVPIASVRRRGGQAVRVGIALFVAFSYLSAMKLAEPFGFAGTLSPLMTVLIPHALFLVAGLVILARTRK